MHRILITIDTEMDADTHWKKNKPVSFTSIIDGIPLHLRPIWDKYNVCPIYFLSPEVVQDEECCKVIREEISKGAIIGAHLHPEYIWPDMEEAGGISKEKFPCSDYSYEIEKEKISNLRDLIKERLDVNTVWYRAARFGADTDTIKILDDLGFKYDSSFTPGIDWTSKGGQNHRGIDIYPYQIPGTKIKEYPITILGKRGGPIRKLLNDNWLFYRWLRPTHMTLIEEKRLLRQLKRMDVHDIVMMFHSEEIMINKSPYVRNRIMQKYYLWRLEKTVDYAIKIGYESYGLRKEQ